MALHIGDSQLVQDGKTVVVLLVVGAVVTGHSSGAPVDFDVRGVVFIRIIADVEVECFQLGDPVIREGNIRTANRLNVENGGTYHNSCVVRRFYFAIDPVWVISRTALESTWSRGSHNVLSGTQPAKKRLIIATSSTNCLRAYTHRNITRVGTEYYCSETALISISYGSDSQSATSWIQANTVVKSVQQRFHCHVVDESCGEGQVAFLKDVVLGKRSNPFVS
ncbi:hypothetical protein CPB83DRAFT_880518 [Crepidotus variabilis]|uniref:Uncharacterized protein n=1 Tax=Crepidotus variabilis TaxID=179855 RepID=A0A9P6EPV2_9AGAR|nr:hypothetical protein CPB83DRAFT_880518 [Crepidotus variabilis]